MHGHAYTRPPRTASASLYLCSLVADDDVDLPSTVAKRLTANRTSTIGHALRPARRAGALLQSLVAGHVSRVLRRELQPAGHARQAEALHPLHRSLWACRPWLPPGGRSLRHPWSGRCRRCPGSMFLLRWTRDKIKSIDQFNLVRSSQVQGTTNVLYFTMHLEVKKIIIPVWEQTWQIIKELM